MTSLSIDISKYFTGPIRYTKYVGRKISKVYIESQNFQNNNLIIIIIVLTLNNWNKLWILLVLLCLLGVKHTRMKQLLHNKHCFFEILSKESNLRTTKVTQNNTGMYTKESSQKTFTIPKNNFDIRFERAYPSTIPKQQNPTWAK